MGQGARSPGGSLGQRHSGARPGSEIPRSEPRDYHVLRWRVSVGAYGGGGTKDGLPQCVLAEGRLQGPRAGKLADEERALRGMTKAECRMTKECRSPNNEANAGNAGLVIRILGLIRH